MKKLYRAEMTAITYGESKEEAEENINQRILIADEIVKVEPFEMSQLLFDEQGKRRLVAIEKLIQTLRRLDK